LQEIDFVRYVYSYLFYLLLPFVFLRLLWKSRRLPAYRQRWGERLGFYPFRLQKSIWIHAVSMGETLAAVPLIKALKIRYPTYDFLVTNMTPTGAARVKAAFGESVKQAYIPYDLPAAVARFLQAMQPHISIIMETELWPNLLAQCAERAIPICLVNARLSARSARGYQRIAFFMRPMLNAISVIAAHGHADAERFIALGAAPERVIVTGSMKFDLEVPPDLVAKGQTLRAEWGSERLIWIAASTHEGEEAMLLAAHKIINEKYPQSLLILVPRHPERFDEVVKLSAQQGFNTIRRSENRPCTALTQVYVGDTMGELLLLYAAADIAFVGGSLIPRGGHNMLEPAVLGKPIVTGPHLFNFAEISELLASAQALTIVQDSASLVEQLTLLLQNPGLQQQMGERAFQVVAANRGALAKQIALVSELIDSRAL
jgi:3-deoxy-D-manno-octulosonic-acid transferase